MRSNALQELRTKYLLDSKSVLNKIKSLRSYFHREHTKVLKKKSGSSTDEVYKSSWFSYKHLLFILEGDETREVKDTITTEESLVSICIWILLQCALCNLYYRIISCQDTCPSLDIK
jgi:hypothetical protein